MHFYNINTTRGESTVNEFSVNKVLRANNIDQNSEITEDNVIIKKNETAEENDTHNLLYNYSSTDSLPENQLFEDILPENQLFEDILGKDILLVMSASQLNILGQTFRPVFTGTVVEVTNGFITLDPVIIKINTAPFFQFPTPLNFPMENIVYFTEFDPNTPIPIH